LQRKVAHGGGPELAPPIVHEVLRSPGHPLDSPTRTFMESRFGHDFSRVRVHADDRAAESAGAIGARAYTLGSHIVFGTGRYASGSSDGRRLLAHELTHVMQQSAGRSLDSITDVSSLTGPRIQRQVALETEEEREEKRKDLCATGQVKGKEGHDVTVVCCYPKQYESPECDEVYRQVYDECWEKDSEKDERTVEQCDNEAKFALCQCLGPKYCKCTGVS